MPEFIGELDCSPYPDGKTWLLIQPYGYRCADGTCVQVPQWFETDFASTPALFWNVVPPWGTYGPAAVIHDWLYWSQTLTRSRSDEILLEAMTLLNVSVLKRQAIYRMVRLFGDSAWDDDHLIALAGHTRIGTRTSPPIPEWNKD
jgi:Protein of unknown function (DUF1353)